MTFEIFKKEGQDFVRLECQWCHTKVEHPVNLEHLENWRQGDWIQDAMPELSPGIRELFISGTCDKCYEEIFE